MNTGKFLLGVLAGAATGTLAGILFAPASGSKTRKKIIKQGEDYSKGLNKKFNKLNEVITEKFKKLKGDISAYTQKISAKPEKTK